jgi:hypothetical protein
MAVIPPSVIGAVTPILADAYTHTQLNDLFMAAGFPGDPPPGNKNEKVRQWMRRANSGHPEPLVILGKVIAEFMDVNPHPVFIEQKGFDPRDRIHVALAEEGLSYRRGGFIFGVALSGPSRSLGELIKSGRINAIEIEYERAYRNIESDSAAAVTAACAILESVCKAYLEENGQTLPNRQVLGTLWPAVAQHLGLSPKDMADDDLKRILQGLFSISDGVGALRTHEGSAHGRSPGRVYRLAARHARLAVHASHTMAMFILETWEARRQKS